jgi:hypothetical protein
MLAVEYSMREFFNSVIMVRWEWLLATIIVVGKMLASRLESRSHVSRNAQPVTRNAQPVTRNAQPGTRNAQPETRNP